MTEVFAVKPAPGVGEVLIGAHFIDAYRVTVAGGDLDAAAAARSMLARQPAWARGLMALRNTLVAPLGLKTNRDLAIDAKGSASFPSNRRPQTVSYSASTTNTWTSASWSTSPALAAAPK